MPITMSVRTLEQINNDYNKIQNKITSLSSDIKTLRTELERLVENTDIDDHEHFIIEVASTLDKLRVYENYYVELSTKKIKLIEEYNSQQQ